jgi:hypothetical protein
VAGSLGAGSGFGVAAGFGITSGILPIAKKRGPGEGLNAFHDLGARERCAKDQATAWQPPALPPKMLLCH